MQYIIKYFFLFTSFFCLGFVIYSLVQGPKYDFTFWNAVVWIFVGFIFHKHFQGKEEQDRGQ